MIFAASSLTSAAFKKGVVLMSGSIETPETSHVVGESRTIEVRVNGYPLTPIQDSTILLNPDVVALTYEFRGNGYRFEFVEATVHGRDLRRADRKTSSGQHSETWSARLPQPVSEAPPEWLYRLAVKHTPEFNPATFF
ncbi:hypothetical protein DVG80_18255 [Rhodococcus erythropolis]|nr:hypothetical protein DVG80_18255 [Rhodococcus erythropolis]